MGLREIISIALVSKLAVNSALCAEFNAKDVPSPDVQHVMHFDIKPSTAEKSLPQLLAMVDLPVIYLRKEINGVKVNSVQGAFSPQEALLRLVANTGLTVKLDEDTGTWLIKSKSRGTKKNSTELIGSETITNPSYPIMSTNRSNVKRLFSQTSKGLLAFLAVNNTHNLAAQDEDGEVFELSPFSVNSEEDSGYRATSTLAGTRLKTDLKNVGSAISILTEEFFDDTGATDAAGALSYAMSTEVSGPQGNFAGNSFNSTGNSANTNSARGNPQSAQRVRGLASAELTRNYFLTDIPFDSYNTDRVTINRGPNSLLFGIGSPGGVINNSVGGASLGKDFGEVSFRLGQHDSNRVSFNYNKVLAKDRLAIRIAGLTEETNYKQKPAFEADDRLFFAFESVLAKNENSEFFGRTVLRGNYESGKIDRNPPEIIPPADGLKDWFSTPNPAIQDIVGIDWATTPGADWAVDGSFVPKWTIDTDRLQGWPQVWRDPDVNGSARETYFIGQAINFNPDGTAGLNVPGFPELSGVQARIQYQDGEYGRFGVNPQTDLHLTKPFEGETFSPNFKVPVIMNRSIFDNQTNLLYGTTSFSNDEFDAYNLTFEQSFLNGNGGLEIAFDKQELSREWSLPFTGNRDYAIRIDVSENLTYNDVPNPNVGRPIIATVWGDMNTSNTDREALRATAFYQFDFTDRSDNKKWLGKHTITGFYNKQEIGKMGESFNGRYVGVDFDFQNAITNRSLNVWLNGSNIRQYLGPSYLNDDSIQSKDDIRITNVANLPDYSEGQEFTVSYFDRNTRTREVGTVATKRILNGGNMSKDEIESNVFSIQSFLLNNNLVGLAGWRKDTINSYEMASTNRLPVTGEFDPENFKLSDTSTSADGDTFTWSLVGHIPNKLPGETYLSFHYNESENFAPSGVRRNALGDILSPPEGKTKEYGFTLDMLASKLVIRANWFETQSSNAHDTNLNRAVERTLGSPLFWLQNFKGAELDGMTIQEAMTSDKNPPEAGDMFASYQEAYDTIIGTLPPLLAERANISYDGTAWTTDPLSGRIATSNFLAEGFELDVSISPTSNWRIGINVSQQETIQNNTATVLDEVANTIKDGLIDAGLWDLNDAPLLGGWTFNNRYTRDAILPVAGARIKDGQVSPEQREWRANAFTNYKIKEGALKGVGIGGALRWQDKVATGFKLIRDSDGNQVPDLSSPFMGSDDLAGDLWLSYERKLTDKIDWKIQLNIRNLIGEDDYIPVVTNPDGSLAVVRNPNPQETFLTNTFKF